MLKSRRTEAKLTSFLASLSVRVLFAAHNDSVCGNENGQHSRQHALDGNKNHSGDCLSCLCNAELFNEDQNAYDRKSPDDLDEDVDDVARFSFVRSVPD
jgi:hypothetical protein